MDEDALDRLLSGNLENLPQLNKKIVRLFISSTFTDMSLERNALMEHVYPRLKKYCKEKHGLEFQVVDMRWGVRDEATDDHQISSLCSREIENCQRMSLGPNFVVFLGDKYGFRPLCNKIKSQEYRSIRRCLIESDISIDLLDTWYKEDTNCLEFEYILQPISSILRNFTNKMEPELQVNDQKKWYSIQEKLQRLLIVGSERLVQQHRLSQDEQLKYTLSVTEREVIDGIINVEEPKLHCLAYLRSIDYMDDHLNELSRDLNLLEHSKSIKATDEDNRGFDENSDDITTISDDEEGEDNLIECSLGAKHIGTIEAMTTQNVTPLGPIEQRLTLIGKYVDLQQDGRLDEKARKALGQLKEVKLTPRMRSLAPTNICSYQVKWSDKDGIDLSNGSGNETYLESLLEHFYSKMVKMIRRASKHDKQKSSIVRSPLISEILQHSHYCLQVTKTFHGRYDELQQLRSYICSGGNNNNNNNSYLSIKQDTDNLSDKTNDGDKWRKRSDSSMQSNYINMPMFLYGSGGSGKTSLLAKAITLMPTWLSNSSFSNHKVGSFEYMEQPACIIVRFLGTTPASSSVISALTSICQQLQYAFYQYGQNNTDTAEVPTASFSSNSGGAFGDHLTQSNTSSQSPNYATTSSRSSSPVIRPQLAIEPIPEDLVRLVFMYKQLLANCGHPLHRKRLFVLALDSVDQLSGPTNLELKFCWILKCRLPHNVRLIISCTSPDLPEAADDDTSHNYPLDEISDDGLKYSLDKSEFSFLRNSLLNQRLTLASQLIQQSKDANQNPTRRQSQTAAIGTTTWSNGRIKWQDLYLGGIIKNEKARKLGIGEDNQDDLSGEKTQPVSSARQAMRRLVIPSSVNNKYSRNELYQCSNMHINENMLHIKPLTTDMATEIMQEWLRRSGRTLTEPQWTTLREALSKCGLPIYLKLAFGEISEWKSYTTYTRQMYSQQQHQHHHHQHVVMSNFRLSNDTDKQQQQQQSYHLFWPEQFRDHINLMNSISMQAGLTAVGATYGQQHQQPATTTGNRQASSSAKGGHFLSSDVQDSINRLFARIELQHGYLLTKHSLSYLTAARTGISENELEDLLSMDDIVLDDVYQYHLPPVRRIPPLLWTRICNDLPNYLSERDSDGIVIQWYHKQFALVVQERYLSDTNQANYIHSTMADYFLGKWADKAKPFSYTEAQLKLIHQTTNEHSAITNTTNQTDHQNNNNNNNKHLLAKVQTPRADRRLPPQPLYYFDSSIRQSNQRSNMQNLSPTTTTAAAQSIATRSTGGADAQKRYNIRKLTELPYHLIKCGRYCDLFLLVLFNYRWIFAKICSSPLQSMLMDLNEASKCLAHLLEYQLKHQPDYPGLDDGGGVTTATIDRYRSMEKRYHETSYADTQSTCMFVEPDQLKVGEISSMIRQIKLLVDTLRLSSSILHTNPDMLAAHLLARLTPLKKDTNCIYINQLLSQCDTDGCHDCALLPTDHCLQTPNGPLVCSLEDHQFAVWDFAISSDERYILSVSNRFIMWDIATGEKSRDVSPNVEGLMMQLKITSDDEFALAYTNLNCVIVMSILTQMVSVLDLNKFLISHDRNHYNSYNNSHSGSSSSSSSSSSWATDHEQLDKMGDDRKSREYIPYAIRGLHLLDSGRDRFLVWTEAHWMVLTIVQTVAGQTTKTTDHHKNDADSEVEIRLESLESIESLIEKKSSMKMTLDTDDTSENPFRRGWLAENGPLNRQNFQIINVKQRMSESLTRAHQNKKSRGFKKRREQSLRSDNKNNNNNVTFCDIIMVTIQNKHTKSSWLLTIEMINNGNGETHCNIWPKPIMVSGSVLVLNTRLNRVFYSDPDNDGQIFMRRLRQTDWSTSNKPIWANKHEKTAKLHSSANLEVARNDSQQDSANERPIVENQRRPSYFGYDLAQQISKMNQLHQHVSNPGQIPVIDQSSEAISLIDSEARGARSRKSELYARYPIALELMETTQSTTPTIELKRTKQNVSNEQLASKQVDKKQKQSSSFTLIVYYINKFVVIYLNQAITTTGQSIDKLRAENNEQWLCHWRHHCLYLPASERNISIAPNKCLTKFQLLTTSSPPSCKRDSNYNEGEQLSYHYAIGAIRKSIFMWSLNATETNGQLLKRFDAHYGRILHVKQLNQLDFTPLTTNSSSLLSSKVSNNIGRRDISAKTNTAATTTTTTTTAREKRIQGDILVASASMDKTVKIWNLANVFEESHNIKRLSMPIQAISLAKQRPLVACLTSKDIGIWDWRTIKLLATCGHFSASSYPQTKHDKCDITINQQILSVDSMFTALKLSSNGVFLATGESCRCVVVGPHQHQQQEQHHVALWNVDQLIQQTSSLEASKENNKSFANGSSDDLTKAKDGDEDQTLAPAGLVFRTAVPGIVRKLSFFSQDTRLLIVSESYIPLDGQHQQQQQQQQSDEIATTTTSDSLGSPVKETNSSQSFSQLAKKIVIQARQVNDGKLLYELEYSTPMFSRSQNQYQHQQQHQQQRHWSSPFNQNSSDCLSSSLYSTNIPHQNMNDQNQRRNIIQRTNKPTTSTTGAYQTVRLPIMTKDQQYLVSVALANSSDSSNNNNKHPIGGGYILDEKMRRRRQSSVIQRPPVVLNVYSSRDGYLMRTIQINQQQQQQQQGNSLKNNPMATNRLLQVPKGGAMVTTNFNDQLSISPDNQFTRLKSITLYKDNRSSVVALLDDEHRTTCLVDIYTKQLLDQFTNWSGKITKDGRYGLSWFSSQYTPAVSKIIIQDNQKLIYTNRASTASTGSFMQQSSFSSSGLELLEMRHCSSIKLLLSQSQLASTTTSTSGARGNRIKLFGFIGPNDQYVYLYSLMYNSHQGGSTTTNNNASNGGILLLIRIRDGLILAKYRPSSEVTSIGASPDRYTLVLACVDGSITSLMVADPNKVETGAKLAQLPSRKMVAKGD